MTVFYEDNNFYYLRKSHGIPSTFGSQKSFLDELKDLSLPFFTDLNKIFGIEKEYGLLNRLDNDTAGLLYFAKDRQIYDNFKELQSKSLVQKMYLVDVAGDFKYEDFIIAYPIMHHIQLQDRMVVIKSDNDLSRGRGEKHIVHTCVQKLYYDEKANISTLSITINKGIRHQIRAHLASIGYPIIGDNIYNKNKTQEHLHLRSIGLKIN